MLGINPAVSRTGTEQRPVLLPIHFAGSQGRHGHGGAQPS